MSQLAACERSTRWGTAFRFLAKRFTTAWSDGSQTSVHIRATEHFKTEAPGTQSYNIWFSKFEKWSGSACLTRSQVALPELVNKNAVKLNFRWIKNNFYGSCSI